MNSEDNDEPGSGRTEASSSSSSSAADQTPAPHKQADGESMKRAAAKKLIERYYYQLTDGCGNPHCHNDHCASSGKTKELTPNQAAAQALHLFTKKAQLCEPHPSKIAKTAGREDKQRLATGDGGGRGGHNNDQGSTRMESNSAGLCATSCLGSPVESTPPSEVKEIPYLTEEKLLRIIEECEASDSYLLLIRTLGQCYSSTESMCRSFLRRPCSTTPLEEVLSKGPLDLCSWKKEDLRQLEGEPDKDEDCREEEEEEEEESPAASQDLGKNHNKSNQQRRGGCNKQHTKTQASIPPDDVTVDIASLRRSYSRLFGMKGGGKMFESALINALMLLCETAELELKFQAAYERDPAYLNLFIIVMEIPSLATSDYLEMVLPQFCRAAAQLPLQAQARLARVWARHCADRLKTMVETVQQLITLKVISSHFTRDFCINDIEAVTTPTKFLKILYYASIIGGELDSVEARQEDSDTVPDGNSVTLGSVTGTGAGNAGDEDSLLLSSVLASATTGEGKESRNHHSDMLSQELGVTVLDCRRPLVPLSDFYNEPLCDTIEMDKDYTFYKADAEPRKFSFMNYSFILTPATKALGLYYDNRIRMYSERRLSFWHSLMHGQPANLYLKLKVRRDRIIDDALVELEMVALENPMDLKKQLVVEFEGEQGVDEGGVSKEFFQLIVEEIFNPVYGMFTRNHETQTFWFNPTSFESDAQFTLIGIVLGLAIYNNIILDVHFPMVVYRKLLGRKGTFEDMQDWDPTLYNGLRELLDYEGDDMEEVFMQNFRISYKDVFGSTFHHDLKEGGEFLMVNQGNKQEFVDLYADFLMNKCVEKQFRAFRKGFRMVTDESPLKFLFTPEEVEQLVCGSKNFDFNELEEATEYDGGYCAESSVIRSFWEIVHELPLDSKRKLLQFATGSDRVPVGGLSKLKLIVARHGPDSDRLPTAHTCFNVLLLPEYSSKEKLKDRLLKAINYSKGFGML